MKQPTFPTPAVSGITLRAIAGAPSPSAAQRWTRRGKPLAAWLLAAWEREQPAKQQADPVRASLDSSEHEATPVVLRAPAAAPIASRSAA